MVKHTEFCGTLDKNSAIIESWNEFTGQKVEGRPMTLHINAGEGATFPWLTGVATRFEKYRFRSLTFKFVPSVSMNYGGALAICPIYDPSDVVPSTRREIYNTEGAVHSPIHQPVTLNIPAQRINKELYVRETHRDLVDPGELRMSDLGYLCVTLFDVDESLVSVYGAIIAYGDIFVSYEVELLMPRVAGTVAKAAHMRFHGPSDHLAEANKYHSITNGSLQEEHSKRGGRDPADSSKLIGHSEHDTLALSYLGEHSGVYTRGGLPVDYDCIQFNEPFTGLLTTVTDHPGASCWPYLCVNGVTSTEESYWQRSADLKHRPAMVEHIDTTSIAEFGNQLKATQLWKVVAQAGESLAVAHATQNAIGEIMDHVVNMSWTEMGEAALEGLLTLL